MLAINRGQTLKIYFTKIKNSKASKNIFNKKDTGPK